MLPYWAYLELEDQKKKDPKNNLWLLDNPLIFNNPNNNVGLQINILFWWINLNISKL